MATFKLPRSICNKIDRITREFLWDKQKESWHCFSPLAWDKICQPKCYKGLGFRCVAEMNIAMLAKTTWTLSMREGSQAGSIFKQKYGIPLQPTNHKPSPVWENIILPSDIVKWYL